MILVEYIINSLKNVNRIFMELASNPYNVYDGYFDNRMLWNHKKLKYAVNCNLDGTESTIL